LGTDSVSSAAHDLSCACAMPVPTTVMDGPVNVLTRHAKPAHGFA
jgi:hypothetical protein